jgi:undecaprenyl-diphosphatase
MTHPRLDPEARYGLRLTLLATAILLVAVPFGWLTVQVRERGAVARWDAGTAQHINDSVHGSRAVVWVADGLSFVGRPVFLAVLTALAAAWLWRRHRYRLLAFLVTTVVTGSILNSLTKILVDRSRPTVLHPVAHESGKSFPSGHAMGSLLVYGALVLVFLPVVPRHRRPLAIGLVAVLVLLIGASRLALGVHFVSDVVGGFILGAAWLTAATAAFRIWRQEEGRPDRPPSEGLEPEVASPVPS